MDLKRGSIVMLKKPEFNLCSLRKIVCGMRIKYLIFIFIPFTILISISCSITREDMFTIASIGPEPEIEVNGYPNNTGKYNFGTVDVYTSYSATFTVENRGTGRLRISAISFIEEDVTWFTIDLSSTVSILSSGENTTFTVKFRPTNDTYQSAKVIILSNDYDESRYTFTVEGSGFGIPTITPDITVKQGTIDIPSGSPVPIDFGKVEIGASSTQIVTIENNDTGELNVYDVYTTPGVNTEADEFSIIAPSIPVSLLENSSTTFTIMFRPVDTGNKSATVTIISDDPDENPYTFTVQGDGSAVPEPDINVKQGDTELPSGFGVYNYGYVESNTTTPPVVFTVENKGTAILNINSISVTSGDPLQFIIDTSSTVFNVEESSSTEFTITFSPDSVAEYKSAIITIDTNDLDENPYTFQVEGEGVILPVSDINVKEVAHNSFYDFGPVLVGTSKTVTFTIENTGTADLNITSVVNINPEKFTLDDTTISNVPPDGGTFFTVTFSPIDTKDKTATIEIYSNDLDENPYRFKVSAYGSEGPEPDINIRVDGINYPTGSEYYFNDIEIGSSSEPVKFIIENKGTGTLEIESILLEWKNIEDFDLDYDPLSLSFSAGGSIPITVWFKPTKSGRRETRLKIRSNDSNEDIYYIKLRGYGI
ncbi:MAG: choice-of-anchor D domain-containing protein [Spirochaetota bacterium]|nr:MAG: choice-of-anchor D domain-containing protein [Spirochaetota bacterium]